MDLGRYLDMNCLKEVKDLSVMNLLNGQWVTNVTDRGSSKGNTRKHKIHSSEL
jgi:hypothetical protein